MYMYIYIYTNLPVVYIWRTITFIGSANTRRFLDFSKLFPLKLY